MADDQVILCQCPRCKRTYRQTVRSVEGIKSRRVRNYEVAEHARAEGMGQTRDGKSIIYILECSKCTALRAPDWARRKLGDAHLQGES